MDISFFSNYFLKLILKEYGYENVPQIAKKQQEVLDKDTMIQAFGRRLKEDG